MHNKKTNVAITALIVSGAMIAFVIFALVFMNNRQDRQNSAIISAMSAQKTQMTTGIKQDTYSYIQKYLGETDENGNLIHQGETSGNAMTQTQINDIVGNVSKIVENTMTDDVMTGASKLAVDDLQKQIEALVDQKVTGLSGDEKSTITQEIEKIVLNEMGDTLTSAKETASTNNSKTQTNTNDISRLKNQTTNITDSISAIKTAVNSITQAEASNSTAVNDKLTKQESDLQANTTKDSTNYDNLKNYVDTQYNSSKKYTDNTVGALENDMPEYSYDKNTGKLTISIPSSAVNQN